MSDELPEQKWIDAAIRQETRAIAAEAECARLRAEVEALRGTFDLQWKADQRAIKRWQAAHPDKQHIWPGRTDLVVWLMEQHDDGARGLGERGG